MVPCDWILFSLCNLLKDGKIKNNVWWMHKQCDAYVTHIEKWGKWQKCLDDGSNIIIVTFVWVQHNHCYFCSFFFQALVLLFNFFPRNLPTRKKIWIKVTMIMWDPSSKYFLSFSLLFSMHRTVCAFIYHYSEINFSGMWLNVVLFPSIFIDYN